MNELIASIYEAALIGDKWISVFDQISARFDARGASIFAWDGDRTSFVASEKMAHMLATTAAAEMAQYNIRAPRLLALNHSGFVSELDLVSMEEINQNRLYQEYLIPMGLHASVGTHIHGIGNDNLVCTIDGFPSFNSAKAAIPALDPLRAHLARAISISARLSFQRAKAIAQALEAIGIPTAVIGFSGRLFAANALFEPLLGVSVFDHSAGIRLKDPRASTHLQKSLGQMRARKATGCSIPVASDTDERSRVLHLMPISGEAQDLFSPDMILLTLAGGNKGTPLPAPLLKVLYDLTPAESQVAQAVNEGLSAGQIATAQGKSVETVRVQIRSILSKTGTNTQRALMLLLRDLYH